MTEQQIEQIKAIDVKYAETKEYSYTDEKNDGACLYEVTND